ncbi:ABC transporter permease subunit [Mesorhizobium sp. SP-1A]|uniref:ABC transporter permease n=1 Tax=Mesorhizobium sp. SP-1A TaxID=3077840 RepID=UPI0028F7194A|nr:ABC transporter permease subunit [Mesorhizobium sp. SP-1A]
MDFFLHVIAELGQGLPLTLEIVGLSLACSFVLGLGLALVRQYGAGWARNAVVAYLAIFRGLPLLIQIYVIYFGLAQFAAVRSSFLWPVLREPFWCAIIAISACASAYACEIFRGGLLSVSEKEIDAARAFAMSRLMTLRRIVLPQALRQALPAYGNEIVYLVKMSAVASIITLPEITARAFAIVTETYRVFEVLSVAGAFYLAINVAATLLVRWLEHALTPRIKPVRAYQAN